MSQIPAVADREFVSGLTMVSRGKVRDTYALTRENVLLPVATDRVSIFDFVLPAEVPQKGEVLTALNVFWFLALGQAQLTFPQDVIAFGRNIDGYLSNGLRGNTELQKRAIVIKKLRMIPVEAIVRGYLTGSGWSVYTKTAPGHVVCGHILPPGLNDGDQLPQPLFTPTTKATVGHDTDITIEKVRTEFGLTIENVALYLFELASKIALERGIILADTKLEFGLDLDSQSGELVLADERFTPDSSRFWLLDDWKRSRKEGRSPTSFDKQFVRNWGKTVGLDKLDPSRPEDIERVCTLTVPLDVIARTAQLYRYVFYLVTGMRLEAFQRATMGIPVVSAPLPPVEVVLGSISDLQYAESGLGTLCAGGVRYRLHIISCHRNPEALQQYAKTMVPPNATVIAAAGKAAALPGVLQAWLRHYGKGHVPVLGVALGETGNRDLAAARLSIECLPGTPVILNTDGKAYCGALGFLQACSAALTSEFFVPIASPKEPEFNFRVA